MFAALIIDGMVFVLLLLAEKFFGFGMDCTRWKIWQCIGWAVVIISAIDQGLVALGVFYILAIVHRLIPIGWVLLSALAILIFF